MSDQVRECKLNSVSFDSKLRMYLVELVNFNMIITTPEEVFTTREDAELSLVIDAKYTAIREHSSKNKKQEKLKLRSNFYEWLMPQLGPTPKSWDGYFPLSAEDQLSLLHTRDLVIKYIGLHVIDGENLPKLLTDSGLVSKYIKKWKLSSQEQTILLKTSDLVSEYLSYYYVTRSQISILINNLIGNK